ncbi:MAG: CBS domain-containing protein [Bacteroidota bacterium]|nr:CBS domain-containing protein [Bacteroidota bacterium]
MNTACTIGSIMTTDVITALPDDTMSVVRDNMRDNIIHHTPVIEEGKVVGMISQNDIHQLEHHFTLFDNPDAEQSNVQLFSTMLAKEIMTTPVITIQEDDTVQAGAELFMMNMFNALPVVDHEGNLKGIVTTFDLIKFAYR